MPILPIFGSPWPGITYVDRPAAYGVILSAEGAVAVVRSQQRFFLPGGGSLPNETPEETVTREVREELGRGVRQLRPLGEAVQFFYAATDDKYYRMRAMFFVVELTDERADAGEHELCWLPRIEAATAFFHESHAWAVRQVSIR